MRTRFAPTPSGYPHLGNAVNALLCARIAQHLSGELLLRIDDIDSERQRPEYREAVSALIDWLRLPITSIHDQQQRCVDRYWAQLSLLAEANSGDVFTCSCTRSQLDSGIMCECSRGISEWRINQSRICMRIDGEVVVLWRREGIPAYHLTSIVDDDRLAITHVVRGEDLRESTVIQRKLSQQLPGSTFADVLVLHHRLLRDDEGAKLSKSSGRHSVPMRLDAQTKSQVEHLVEEIWSSDVAPWI